MNSIDTSPIQEKQKAVLKSNFPNTENLFAVPVQLIEEAVTIIDAEGRILFVNHHQELLADGDIIGTSLFDFVEDELKTKIQEAMEQVIQSGKAQRYTTEYQGADGHTRLYNAVLEGIREDGKLLGYYLVSRDITDEVLLKKELLRSTNLLRGLRKKHKELSYLLSHDLHRPLSNLEMLNEVLRLPDKGKLTEEQQADVINKSLTLIKAATEELMRVLSGKNDQIQKIKSLEVDRVLDEVLIELDTLVINAKAVITRKLGAKNIKFSKHYLYQILFNLLSNSLLYREPDKQLFIEVKTYEFDGWHYLQISDNGKGIPPKTLDDLNSKSYHKKPGDQHKRGLGLFYTGAMAESFGGEMTLESNLNLGTTVTIKLSEIED